MKNYNEENNIDRDEVLAFAFEDIINESSRISKAEGIIKSQLPRLFMHMLKYMVQQDHQTGSWINTIRDSSRIIIETKNDCKASYNAITNNILESKYKYAIQKASEETGIDKRFFPSQYPPSIYFTKENIFNKDSIEKFLYELAYSNDAKKYLGL